jgi:hypothetical protein
VEELPRESVGTRLQETNEKRAQVLAALRAKEEDSC